MPRAANLMGSGIGAWQAMALGGRVVNSTVTAAGTTQGTATQVRADFAVVSTATTGQGVILTDGVVGDSQEIYNGTTVDIRVYPPTGGAVNQLSANTGFVLPPSTAALCKKVTSTQWVGYISG